MLRHVALTNATSREICSNRRPGVGDVVSFAAPVGFVRPLWNRERCVQGA